ncbi:MAG: glycosyltransferase [bacterium]|nr:glycosyltransferase [bacterium]
MKSILHVITSLNIGGTEKFLLNSLRNLNAGYNFTVCYLKERGPIADEIEKLAIPVFHVRGLRDLVAFIRQHPMDVVHTHLYRANIIGRLAAHMAGVRTIISSQRSIDDWKDPWHVWLDRWTAKYTKTIIANSQYARDLLTMREKIPAKKIKVIYNGIEPQPEFTDKEWLEFRKKYSLADKDVLVGCVTRFHREKGVRFIPEIVRTVIAQHPRVKFILAGDGPEKDKVAAAIARMNLSSRVYFTGFYPEAARITSLCSVFFLASLEESFPQALLEAMAAGVPSVCTDVGGVKELITTRETGLLVKPADPRLLAETIIWLLDHPAEAQAMGDKARILVQHSFQLSAKIQQLREIYG